MRLLDEAESLRATRTRANARMEQFVPALFQEMFGNIVANDKRWQMIQFSEIVKKEKYSLMRGPFGGSVKKEIFVPDGYKIYEQKHAIQDNFDLGNYFIDETKYKELISFAIQPDDLIVSCSGTIGKVAIIPSTAKPGIINQALMKIRPDQEIVLPIFIKLLLETNHMQLEFFGGAEGSAIKNVKPLKYIKQTKVPLPPLALQREFAARVEEARGVQSAQGKSAGRVEALYQSMLARAFAGEL